MKIIISQISDIHFRSKDNPILDKTDEIIGAISSVCPSSNDIGAHFIVCSGDMAFSGKGEEYKIAERFLSELKEKISKISRSTTLTDFLIVPGNHDCNFSKDNAARKILLDKLATSSIDEWDASIIESCLVVQVEYEEFLSSLEKNNNTTIRDKIFRVIGHQVGNYTLEFRLINSATLSKLNEKQGALVFPQNFIQDIEKKSTSTASVVITVIHHPYNWFEANNARTLRDLLEKTSDIILTGHEHEPDNYTKLRDRECLEYVEGGVLQDVNINNSSFNVISIDLSAETQTIHQFNWSKNNKRYEEDKTPQALPFIRNTNRLKNEFHLKPNFGDYLNDPGANFTHPGKENIILEDIFISPHFRLLQEPGEDEEKSKIIRETIDKFVLEHEHVLILGPEKSGKTTVAKVLIDKLRQQGNIPVLIDGGDIKKVEEGHIFNLVDRSFENQYEQDLTSYKQLQKEKRAIIIDNFQDTRINSKGRDKVVSTLEGFAKMIVILGETKVRFEDIIDEEIKELHLWKYFTCEILPFGHLKRHDLIKKWFFVGRELTENINELTKKVMSAENLVSQLIGKNLAPSYPLFILAFLQQIEAQTPLNINSTSGSYGFLYESLLTTALAQSSKLSLDLDTQYTYLSELAFYFFTSKIKYLKVSRIFDWHNEYCRKFQRRLDYNEMLKNFTAAGVLLANDNNISFHYPYLYYYFLGRYFKDHINEESIRDYIVGMSKKLHYEEAANVLIFLSYLSKDSIIINSILESANGLFSNNKECDLIQDTIFLNDIIAEIPKLLIDGRNSEERHREVLSQQDESSRTQTVDNDEEVIEFESIPRDEELDEFLKVNVALKTIQILGQILRNYPGSLRGDEKIEIANSAYKLGLRVLKYMLGVIESSKQEIVEFLVDILRDRYPKWTKERLEARVGSMVFSIAEGLSIILIRQITDSVGHESLSMTFDELSQKNNNISFKFINMNISMHHYRNFPRNEILSLYQTVRKNGFASQLVSSCRKNHV